MNDPYHLQRFVDAQNPVFEEVCSELRAGRKESHWMWFVFPQLKGLGRSWMAEEFGISSLAEAEAYLQHAILGPRLRECTRLVNSVVGRSVEQIFGSVDSMKFRSSMTLFAQVVPGNEIFVSAIAKYFEGKADRRTLELL
ncbi:MAG TPA: DUF1810 domain-containing protein [Bryobacteraceae bacterium]|nr:DUF1810 domain-containing protein [Bryobacteraceae bacterium]